jgi:hypothetical protein
VKALLGLAGQARSGKDTVASMVEDILKEEVPDLDVHRDAFANRLKVSAAHALGFKFDTIDEYRDWSDRIKSNAVIQVVLPESPYRPVEGPVDIIQEISGREYLQFYGTEAHREVFDKDFWVWSLLEDPPECDLLIVTDVRFPNEAEAIREMGGEVWEVYRTETATVPVHASEEPLPASLIDCEITNDGTLEELKEQVKELLDG